ncbi:MAG: hypothetical protein NTY20_05740 [Candidatus Aenigmarchaeota archaeon]|nr:hypothetical protein [Candidatus Aenigmarchaeota archaeon]
MRILIILGMLIVFISAFFILFIFDTIVKEQVKCMAGLESSSCDLREAGKTLIAGLTLIAMFLIIDGGVLYMIIKSITESGSSYIAYSV